MMNKKILIVYAKSTAEIFNRQSALGSYIHCLANILLKNGYCVRINDLDTMPSQQTFLTANTSQSSFKKLFPSFFKEYVKDKHTFSRINQLFNKIDNGKSFDKILEFYTYGSDIGLRLSKKYNKPLVLIYDGPVLEEHSFFHTGQAIFKNRIEKRERFSILQSESIVVYSNAVKNYLVKKMNKQLPCFIHQNVDYTRFEFIDKKPFGETINIGFIGSFLKWHRVDLLLRVFTKLKNEGNDVKLFLLGNGMEFSKIKGQVSQNKYFSEIEIPGYMDGEQLHKYKQNMHIGIMPGSNWYGAPNKIFEYGAAKMAVVAPDTATIRDLFEDKKDLLLFKQDDEIDLFNKLKIYIDNREVLNKHASLLQLKIQRKYSESITFDFYDELIQKNE